MVIVAACFGGQPSLAADLADIGATQWTPSVARLQNNEEPATYRDQAGEVPTPKPSPQLKWRIQQPASMTESVPAEAVAAPPTTPAKAAAPTTTAPARSKPDLAKITATNSTSESTKATPAKAEPARLEPIRLTSASKTATKPEAVRVAAVLPADDRGSTVRFSKGEPKSVLKAAHEAELLPPPGEPTTSSSPSARSIRVQLPFDDALPKEAPKFTIPDEGPLAPEIPLPRAVRQEASQPTPRATPMELLPLPAGPSSSSAERCPKDQPCKDSLAECNSAWELLKKNPLSAINLDIALKGVQGEDYPCECTLRKEAFPSRHWPMVTYTWKASGICYRPLRFEEAELERYGQNHGHLLQPFISGGHFVVNVIALPYNMGVETPEECIYPLGYYRPGDCAPRLCPAVPLGWRPGLAETAAVLALAFVVP